MKEIKYLDDSSAKIVHLGGKLSAWFKVSSSLKAVTSRVRTNPKSKLTNMACIVSHGNDMEFAPIGVADLLAFRLPVDAVGIMLVFIQKGSKLGETFSVTIDLEGKSLEIIGNRDSVVDLCSWLYVPLWGNV